MSRLSYAARAERLKRQLRGEPVVRVTVADWFLDLMGGPLSAALLAERARLKRPLFIEEVQRITAKHRTSEPGR